MHHPTHEVALDTTGALVRNTQGGTNHAARPIGADHELRTHMHQIAPVHGAHPGIDMVGTGFKTRQAPTEANVVAGPLLGVLEQHRLDPFL